MRIRSIRPEFWRSDDIDALDHATRLLFIGLWSYVDDNGVGRDRVSDIAGDLFSGDLSREPRETLARVSEGLGRLLEGGLISRYEVANRRYLHVTSWAEHQKIDKPGRARYPLPTCDDAQFATPSRHPRETPATGEGEKRRRGEEEKHSPSVSEAPKRRRATRLPDDFPVTDELAAWAATEAPNAGPRDHEDFCDYWHAKAGKDATKLDWDLTWKRWMRKASDERASRPGGRAASSPRPGPDQRAAEVADLAARLQAQRDAGTHQHAIGQ